MSKPTVTVVVSSFDQPRSLALALSGYMSQTVKGFEMIIADDGSGHFAKRKIEEFVKVANFPVDFVTQMHQGFRKAKILNKAVAKSNGDIIVFTDGDCIPFPDLVERHCEASREGRYSVGGYVYLDLEESRSLSPEAVMEGEHLKFLDFNRRASLNWIHKKNLFYKLTGLRNKPKILGGNFSVLKKDFYAVNGFDERFSGFSGEDSDIRNRLNAIGLVGTSLWNRAFVCHIDHGIEPHRLAPSYCRLKRDKSILMENMVHPVVKTGVYNHLVAK